MTKVLNKRTDIIPPNAIYVGRPSKWGNKYKIGAPHPVTGKLMTRLETILLYTADIESSPEIQRQAKEELAGFDLVCWCAPLPCHADVLLELANEQD